MNFRSYTTSYAVGTATVIGTSDPVAMVREDVFAELQEEFGQSYPLVFKLGTRHLPVYACSAMPKDVLTLPTELLDELGWRDGQRRQVYCATGEMVQKLIEWSVVPEEAVI
jgi:hypothetical protein